MAQARRQQRQYAVQARRQQQPARRQQQNNPVLEKALMSMRAYADAGQMDEAMLVVKYAAQSCENKVAQILFSAAIKMCADKQQHEQAISLLVHMNEVGPKPNLVCYNAAMSACIQSKQAQKALDILPLIRSLGLQPDNFTCSTALKAFATLKKCEEALIFFYREMPKMGVTPNAHAYCAAINACEKGGQWLRAIELFRHMQECGVVPTTVVCSSLISACKVGGHWKEALEILHSMESMQVEPDAHSYCSAISACAKAGKFREAIETFEMMRSSSVKPTLVTYGAILSACEAGKQWYKAKDLLETMPMKPDRICYSIVIRTCSRANQLAPAFSAFDNMVNKAHFVPDNIIWEMMMQLCVKAGDYARAEKILALARSCGVDVRTKMPKKIAAQASDASSWSCKDSCWLANLPRKPLKVGYQAPDTNKAVFCAPPGLDFEDVCKLSKANTKKYEKSAFAFSTQAEEFLPGMSTPAKLGKKTSPIGSDVSTEDEAAASSSDESSPLSCKVAFRGPPGLEPPETAWQLEGATGLSNGSEKLSNGIENRVDAFAYLKSTEFELAPAASQAGAVHDAIQACANGGDWEQAVTDIVFDMGDSEVTPTAESLLVAAQACRNAQRYEWAELLDNQRDMLSALEAGM